MGSQYSPSLHESWKHGVSFLCWRSVDLALFDSIVNTSCPVSALPISVCGLRGFRREPVIRVLSPASSRVCKGILVLSLTLSYHRNEALDNSLSLFVRHILALAARIGLVTPFCS